MSVKTITLCIQPFIKTNQMLDYAMSNACSFMHKTLLRVNNGSASAWMISYHLWVMNNSRWQRAVWSRRMGPSWQPRSKPCAGNKVKESLEEIYNSATGIKFLLKATNESFFFVVNPQKPSGAHADSAGDSPVSHVSRGSSPAQLESPTPDSARRRRMNRCILRAGAHG